MKHKRQAKLLELVRENNVETQEALMELLHAHGFRVTQATISRDIKELRLVKVPNGQGVQVLAAHHGEHGRSVAARQAYL